MGDQAMPHSFRSLRDLPSQPGRVLVRADFNVPLDHGRVSDDTRIRETLPTLAALHAKGARVILCSHLGRPKGKPDPRYSLRPVAERLSRLLSEHLGRDVPVGFCPVTVGLEAEEMSQSLEPGGFLLLENLRFQPGEEANDPEFARQLAQLADVYINDAFGSAHRAHASTVGITRHLPLALAGRLMEKELQYLGRALHTPEHPYVVILGGAKISDKIPVLASLARQADVILIGGGMAYTFLAAQGIAIGDSLFEPEQTATARDLLQQSQAGKFQLLLPVDHVVAPRLAPGVKSEIVTEIPAGQKALDIGPQTRSLYASALAGARMILWNGPMGVFEVPPFDQGTLAVAQAVAATPAVSIVGGGDSVAAVHAVHLADRMSHISTGGGASLEYLSGAVLPGVAALTPA